MIKRRSDEMKKSTSDAPLLEVHGLHFEAGGKEILKGADLKVPRGKIFSIVGVNGTGKSTLAALIMGLDGYVPSRGKIIFEGDDITGLSLTERAKLGITLGWQIPASFEGITVKEYLSVGKRGISPSECLKLVGLNPDVYLNRPVDESLSGGERKRIELASVFCVQPKLVILDEPDSGIDMASINIIKEMIEEFRRNDTSVLLITHSGEMAEVGDSVALLCDGRIVKEGDVDSVTRFFRKNCRSCDHVGEIEEGILR